MATSGSTDYSVTRNDVINEALELIQVLPPGETPTDAEITSAARTLNILIKALQSDQIYLWAVDSTTAALVASTASYSLADGTNRVLSARITVDGQDIDLEFMNRNTYEAIPVKTDTGQPKQIYVAYGTSPPVAYIYPVPDGSYTMTYSRERALQDFDAATDNPDLPLKALQMLVFGLAHKLGFKYQIPITERQYLEMQFEKARNAYKAGDTEFHSRMICAPNNVV